MSRFSVFGSYNDHSAIVCIDENFPTTRLSARFAGEHGLREAEEYTMRLPSVGGVYVSRMRMAIDASLTDYDLMVGADWLAATHAVLILRGLAQPSKREILLLRLRRRPGHTWEATSKGILTRLTASSVSESHGLFQSPLSFKRQGVPPIQKGPEPSRRCGFEVPFDITHYILSFLANTLNPHSYQLEIDTRTLQRLCLVSRSFNAAANAVLYSSIAVSELTLLSLAATARTNPALFRHCHSLWFQPPLYRWHVITLSNIAHIISCCPNLRRVEWLHRAGPIQMSMFNSHLPQMTDLLFPHIPLLSLHISPTHAFPRIERLVVANAHFVNKAVVSLLLRMPRLTDLMTDPPPSTAAADVEAYARGIATVVTRTTLRRIIWVHIFTTADGDDWEKTPKLAEFDRYRPICARAHEILRATPEWGSTDKDVLQNTADGAVVGKRPKITFEFVARSIRQIRNYTFDGRIWNPSNSRARFCP